MVRTPGYRREEVYEDGAVTQTPIAGHSLADFRAQHDFFVGIDSDGTVFDSMEIKHIECFLPNIIKYWSLQPIVEYVRDTTEFVNLYSPWRGVDRWTGLVIVFDLLRRRPEVQASLTEVPRLEALQQFIKSDFPPSDNGLQQFMAGQNNAELKKAWQWSEAANEAARDLLHDLPPFPYVRECLEKLAEHADMAVISSNPTAALVQDWEAAHLAEYVEVIAGQEFGRKSRQLRLAADGRYPKDQTLMIGDALSDLKTARAHHMLFYPINPGGEAQSWEQLYRDGIDRFRNGEFAGPYESGVIAEFEALMQATPPWQKNEPLKISGTTDYAG